MYLSFYFFILGLFIEGRWLLMSQDAPKALSFKHLVKRYDCEENK